MKSYLFITLFALTALLSCNNGSQQTKTEEPEKPAENNSVQLSAKQQQALHLTFGTVQKRNLTTVVKVNGQLEVAPAKKADVTAIVGGNVKKINVFTGDKVKKRQTLAVLEHPDFIKLQEDFAVVANNQEFLEQEYKRQKELYENEVGSGKDYQKAKTEYNISKAKYQGLKSRLELLNLSPEEVKKGNISSTITIVSPLTGYVNEVNIKLGTYVNAETILFEIADNSAIHADFMVYEKDVHLLKKGQKIHFTVANQIGKEFTATVFAIGKKFDSSSRAINIHAKINQETTGLIPGMYVTGHLHTDNIFTNALPDDAIVKEGEKSFIFIVDSTDKNTGKTSFKMREVIPGKKDEGYTEVSFIEELPKNAQIVMNSAYYLLSEMNKDELGEDD